MPTVTAWFTTAFALSTTAGGRFSKRRPATNSPSWTASGREAVDIAVSTVQPLARAEHLSDVEPLRAESLAPSWGEGVAPARRKALSPQGLHVREVLSARHRVSTSA